MPLDLLPVLLDVPPNGTLEASLSGSRSLGAKKGLEFVYADSLLVRLSLQFHFLHLFICSSVIGVGCRHLTLIGLPIHGNKARTFGHAPSLLLANQRGVTLDCPKKRVTVGVARRTGLYPQRSTGRITRHETRRQTVAIDTRKRGFRAPVRGNVLGRGSTGEMADGGKLNRAIR